METLNAVVVGCGNIGAKFDLENSQATFPLTHAASYSEHPNYSLLACVEPNEKKRFETQRRFAPRYAFRRLEELAGLHEAIDVVSLCSPTELHQSNLETIIALKPRLVFCEKPITPTVQNSLIITEKLESEGIQVVVNYTRRWDPSIIEFRDKIAACEFGTLRAVSGFYNKGILNNGSHMINMLSFLIGNLRIVATGEPFYDEDSTDPTMAVILKDDLDVPITLSPTSSKDYSHFECSFAFSEAMITMREGGIYWETREKTSSSYFAGYSILGKGVVTEGRYVESMTLALNNIYEHLMDSALIVNDAKSAIHTQSLCEQLAELAGAHGK
jgi:predicted dehydrogenase